MITNTTKPLLRPSRVEPRPDAIARAATYPQWRIMGSKHKLLPWIHDHLQSLRFETAIDAFSGSGCVGFLLKCMGKSVVSNDHLNFAHRIASALVANPGVTLTAADVALLLRPSAGAPRFIRDTFGGIFFPDADNEFLDRVWANLPAVRDPHKRAVAIAALCRAAIKKQPRGVFTTSCLRGKTDDGRRDLTLSLEQQFRESVALFGEVVFDNGKANRAVLGSAFDAPNDVDLAYFDPPYVPRADDNCYVKRYHFIEGLSVYWKDLVIMPQSKVKKIEKVYTPFSYRKDAVAAFERLFARFRDSILVLSYSSNGYPDKDELVRLMSAVKRKVTVHENEHRYHFGTHGKVSKDRALVREYLIVGE